jgi:PAS domain S-box-containing protein
MDTSLPAFPQPDSLAEEIFQARHHALLRAILDNISEGVFVSDPQGRPLYYSPFAEKLIGAPVDPNAPPEAWSESHGIFFPDMNTPFPSQQLPGYRALQGEEARDVDMFVRNHHVPEGQHVRVSASPVRDREGRTLGALALVRDISSERQAEAERRRTEQRFRLLVETAQEGIWTIDTEARTTYANRYLAEMLGYTPEEMMGMHLFSFMDEEGRALAVHNLERRHQGVSEVQDFKYIRKDGRPIWVLLSTSPIHDENGRYVGALAMVTDITRRREAEEQVRRLNEGLERRVAERTAQLEFSNRELEAFAYSVAHDLRAPLRSISSFSQALAEDCADRLDADGLDYLRRIRAAAGRMAELIDGILALSRVNRTEMVEQACDLSAMARSVVEQLRRWQPERPLKLTVQEGLMDRGDPRLMRGLLENLLGNAWKFTRPRPVAEIEFGALEGPGGARTYYVRDNGAGFDMAYQEKLFGVFQRLHTQTEFEGNGVGLATVQRIVHRHGGRVWAEGQVDRGATFFFTLHEPLPAPRAAEPPTGA